MNLKLSSGDTWSIIKASEKDSELLEIARKVLNEERISPEECVVLYEKGSLGFVGTLANFVRQKKHGQNTYFNRNFHIEPTNKCVFDCKFCSYSRAVQTEDEAWELSLDQMLHIVHKYDNQPVTEVHVVGGVYPRFTLAFFKELFLNIKKLRPGLHIKGLTAVELEYIFRKAKVSIKEGLTQLQQAGLDSIPGGGAEIFDKEVRDVICRDKASTDVWLEIHKTAHEIGMHSNATMLYGHIEKYYHRADHMDRLRQLQDKTGGFNTFIPLKFRNKDNEMSNVPEVSVIEDLRNYAISRIFLDNISHIKAYWVMIGRNTAQLSLNFGVDDLDGTIDDTTKIYTMAGAEEQSPSMSVDDLVRLISQSGHIPIERDTLYNVVNRFEMAEAAV